MIGILPGVYVIKTKTKYEFPSWSEFIDLNSVCSVCLYSYIVCTDTYFILVACRTYYDWR